jgi:two-component system response regulator (stage 0 sporulation protein A)
MGGSLTYRGFQYTVYGVERILQDPNLMVGICKGLYFDIAEYFDVEIDNVERDIRTLIGIIWDRGDRDMLNRVFGRKLERKPGNAQFLDAVTQYLILKEDVDEEINAAIRSLEELFVKKLENYII